MKYNGSIDNRNQKGAWKYLESLRLLARKNRSNPTESEKYFWEKVLKYDKTGYRFLRQKPISRFILDFYCSKLLLAIEIDGDVHNLRKNYDVGRDQILYSLGIKTIRYNADEVLNNISKIILDVSNKIKKRKDDLVSL